VLVSLPSKAPDDVASVVELTLDGPPVTEPYVITADKEGVIRLGAEAAEIQSSMGQRAKKENALGHVFLTNWSRAGDVPVWTFRVPEAGRYNVILYYGSGRRTAGTPFTVNAGDASLSGKVEATGNDWVFKPHQLGAMELAAGEQTLQIKAEPKGAPAMTLERIVLKPL